jgi:Peptidase family M1 domain
MSTPLPSTRSLQVVWSFAAAILALGSLAALSAQTPAAPVALDVPLSPRNASYTIDVTLDPATRMLRGHQVLAWTNLQDQPTSELWFHLYWNAWRNDRSTWMLEDRLRRRSDRGDDIEEGDWSWIDVQSARLLPNLAPAPAPPAELAPPSPPAPEGTPSAPAPPAGAAPAPGAPLVVQPPADLMGSMRFASPDDGNPEDRTVLVVTLPRPVAPGETVRVEMTWSAKIPRTFARTGFRGDFFFIGQWFPMVGVLESDGWNCHQFHAATEFFSDYGVYDVSITVPKAYVVGATGVETESRDNPDGTTTHRFRQPDVHTFAWTASPDYLVRTASFAVSGLPPVEMRLLLQPEHVAQAARHFAATRVALEKYGRWYGAYPYGHITIVDPAFGSGAGGMEYPTLFTAGTRLFAPLGGGSPEGVTIHECGHQFWYGIVGDNEFENAWLDEGLNTFSTARAYDAAYGQRRFVQRYLDPPGSRDGFLPVLFPDLAIDRMVGGNRLDSYRSGATSDSEATPTFRYYPPTAAQITYSKTALWLSTLERYLGWPVLQKAMATFFERYRFKHPRPEDFFAVVDEVSGRDMTWFFDQVYRGSDSFDYAIESVASFPAAAEGFVEEEGKRVYQPPPDEGEATGEVRLYRTEVVVRRIGGATFPVDVELVFADGSKERRSWDGKGRWTMLVEEKPFKLSYAVVDPDRVLLLDLDYTNNSRRLKSAATFPAVKWASKWMVWFQDLLSTFGYFV